MLEAADSGAGAFLHIFPKKDSLHQPVAYGKPSLTTSNNNNGIVRFHWLSSCLIARMYCQIKC